MERRRFSGTSRQIAACVVGSLPVFMSGIVLGWPSPVIGYMIAGQAPLTLTESQTSWMVAFIDVGNFFMAIPAGRLMDRIGRKFTLSISGPLMFVGWLFILFGRQPWQLYVARLLQGAAVAISFVVAPAFVGELASVRIRGKLGLLIQINYALGLLFAYTAGWLLNYTALAVTSGIISIVSSVLFLFLPESPYYLMLAGRSDDATKCLWKLRSYTSQELESEIVTVQDSVMNDTRGKGNIRDLLTRDRRPLVIVLVMAVLQMASGASVLEAYGSSVLVNSGVSSNALAVFLGLTILVAAVPFALAVDRYGRRPLMLISCFGTAACHVAVVLILWHRLSDGIGSTDWWLPLFIFISGVQFFINIGIMPMLSIVECEYFPSDTRALADGTIVLVVTLSSTVFITTYQATAGLTQVINYAVFATMSFAGGVFCYAVMPETKCKTFVEIQKDFRPLARSEEEYEQI